MKPAVVLVALIGCASGVPLFDQALNLLRVPLGVASELTGLLTGTSTRALDQCPRLQEANVKLLLYTRHNRQQPVLLDTKNSTQIHPRKKVILIIHGWLSNPTSFGFPSLKTEYLKRYDCNVIMVDWSIPAWNGYKTVYCFIPQVARVLANFLCLLQQQLGIPVNSVHLVGHSFGAQMSGFASQDTLAICGQQVGRITAMDPAKPFYQGIPTSQRLDKDDAIFVDVLHTNEGVLGYFGNCGDVDFYVNCGTLQPGCPDINIGNWIDHPLAALTCEHFRSVEFMADSINSNKYKAQSCQNCPMVCHADQSNLQEITMGEHCPRNASGAYVVYTASESSQGMGLGNLITSLIPH